MMRSSLRWRRSAAALVRLKSAFAQGGETFRVEITESVKRTAEKGATRRVSLEGL
jgi:hypothetical protein